MQILPLHHLQALFLYHVFYSLLYHNAHNHTLNGGKKYLLYYLFFSPGFGESYYEIFYLGNHSGIVKFGAWHNRFDMNNLLTVEIPIGRAALRIGYDNRIRTSRANHLDYFHYTNAFVIGVATPINRTPSTSGRSTIQAYY